MTADEWRRFAAVGGLSQFRSRRNGKSARVIKDEPTSVTYELHAGQVVRHEVYDRTLPPDRPPRRVAEALTFDERAARYLAAGRPLTPRQLARLARKAQVTREQALAAASTPEEPVTDAGE